MLHCCECKGYCLEEIGPHMFCVNHRPPVDNRYFGTPDGLREQDDDPWTCSNCLTLYKGRIKACYNCHEVRTG